MKRVGKSIFKLSLFIMVMGMVFGMSCYAIDPLAKGIDVSYAQGSINWDAVKSSGKVDFAMIRLGWDKNGSYQLDSQFKRNMNETKRVGIKRGVYHYFYAENNDMAIIEANNCINALKDCGIDKFEYPFAVDIEDDKWLGKIDRNQLTGAFITFANIMEQAGYWVSLYANPNWLNNHLNTSTIKPNERYALWLAHWIGDEGKVAWNSAAGRSPSRECGMWQYGAGPRGTISGIDSAIDLDYAYLDYPAYMIRDHKNGY